jgi:hypothetical protein
MTHAEGSGGHTVTECESEKRSGCRCNTHRRVSERPALVPHDLVPRLHHHFTQVGDARRRLACLVQNVRLQDAQRIKVLAGGGASRASAPSTTDAAAGARGQPRTERSDALLLQQLQHGAETTGRFGELTVENVHGQKRSRL